MYALKFLRRENDLNKVIKSQKRDRSKLKILFISLWDDWSLKLVEALKEKYGSSTEGERLFIVDSFSMPHSFVIYGTSSVPQLVALNRDKVTVEARLPVIYHNLLPTKSKKYGSRI